MPDFEQDIIRRVRIETQVDTDTIKKSSATLDNFYRKYQNKDMKVDTSDFFQAIDAVRSLRKELDTTQKNSPQMTGIIGQMSSELEQAAKQFGDAIVHFTNGDIANGLNEAVDKITQGLQVKSVDLGEFLSTVKWRARETVDALKEIGALSVRGDNKFLKFDNLDLSGMNQALDLMQELYDAQKELDEFNGKPLEQNAFYSDYTTQALLRSLKEIKKELQIIDSLGLNDEQLLKRRKLKQSVSDETFDTDYFRDSIKPRASQDKEEYDWALSHLTQYISKAESLISEFKANSSLFTEDELSNLIGDSTHYIEQAKTQIKELQQLGKKDGDPPIGGDFTEVVRVLNEIKTSLRDISDVFQNTESSMRDMAENSKLSLEGLSQTIIEVYNNLTNIQNLVDTISQKDFNINNITQVGGGNTQVSQFKEQAHQTRQALDHAKKLTEELYQLFPSLKGDDIRNATNVLNDFFTEDFDKQFRGAKTVEKMTAMQLALESFITTLTQLNELRGKYGFGEWTDTFVPKESPVIKPVIQPAPQITETPTVVQPQNTVATSNTEAQDMWQLKAAIDEVSSSIGRKNAGFIKEKEIVDASVDAEEAKLRELVSVITDEIGNALDSIKEKFSQSFVVPELDNGNLQTSLDNIYNRFIELKNKIESVKFNVDFTNENPDIPTKPQSTKTTSNMNSDISVENSNGLVAIHGISSKNLMSALKTGAFSSPSIALTKPDVYAGGYGDSAVVFKKSAIDPALSPDNKIYGVDAYTPTYPLFGYELNEENLIKASERAGISIDTLRYVCDGAYENIEEAVDHLSVSLSIGEDLKNSFIKERGFEIKTSEIDEETRSTFHVDDGNIHNGARDIIARDGFSFDNLINNEQLQQEYFDAIDKYVNDYNAQFEGTPFAFAQIKEELVSEFKNNIKKASTDESIYNELKDIFDSDSLTVRGENKTLDIAARNKEILRIIDENRKDYNDYVREILEEVMVKPNVKGAHGQRFDRTPDGIAAAMSSFGGKNALYDENPFMTKTMDDMLFIIGASKTYSSMDEVEADASRLQKDAPGSHTVLENGHIESIARIIAKENNIEAQEVFDKIIKAVDGNSTEKDIGEALKNSGLTVSDDIVGKIAKAAQEAANVKTKYFEAKPQKALGLDAIDFVAVPKDDVELKAMLEELGIKTVEHDPYDDSSRSEALKAGLQSNIVSQKDFNQSGRHVADDNSVKASVDDKAVSVVNSASDSAQAIDGESQSAVDVTKPFIDASNAKKEFVEANKQVAESAKESTDSVKKEAEAAKTVADDVGNAASKVAKDLAKTKDVFNDDGDLIQTDTTRKFTTDEAFVTETDSTKIMRDADGNETTSTITTIVKDFERLSKETKKSEEAVARAQKKLDEFLARFQSKSGGNAKFITGFSDLEGTKVTSDNMEDVFNKMMALQEEYSKLETNFRKGQSSLNPFVNAITKSENIDNVFGDIEIKFNGLINKSDELVDNFKRLQELSEKIKSFTQLMNTDPDSITPEAFVEFSKQVGEFNVLKSKVDGAIKTQSTVDADAEKKRKKEVEDYINLVKQKNEYEAKATKGDNMQPAYEEKIAELKEKIAANDKQSIMTQEEKNRLLTIEEAHQMKIAEIKQKQKDKQLFNTQNDRLKGKAEAGYLSQGAFDEWQGELAKYQSYLDGTVQADEATINEQKKNLTKLYDHLNKISNASKTFFASGGEILPNWLSTEQIDNAKESLMRIYEQLASDKFAGKKTEFTGFSGANEQVKKLTFTVNDGKGSLEQYTIAMDAASGATKLLNNNTKNTLSTTQQFIKALKGDAKGMFSAFLGGMSSMYAVGRYLKEGIQDVRELDKALTELKKVTDATEEAYDKFLDTASKTGARIGSTLSNFTSATAEFAKLGYNIETAASMAESALVYTNVGDNIDVETGSQSIISTLKAFGIEANNTMSIVDKFNEVGNNFAITTKGIGDALQVSASAMAAAGNSLDETIALTTAANTVVQNPNTVGKRCADIKSGYISQSLEIGKTKERFIKLYLQHKMIRG